MPIRIVRAAPPPSSDPLAGLLFPENIGAPDEASSVRLKWTGANLIQPFPATFLWKFRPVQQTGYYTTFFHGPDGSFTAAGYYGFHPYPPGGSSGTTHKWEISIDGNDFVTDDNANDTTVVKDGTIYAQAATVQQSGAELLAKFYWDLRDTSKVITVTTNSNYASGFPPTSPALSWGTAPWQPNVENGYDMHRGWQQYAAVLTLPQILARIDLTTNASVVAADPGSLWYVNLNPTPSDVQDKSGAGHHPSWQNSNRPTLWTP